MNAPTLFTSLIFLERIRHSVSTMSSFSFRTRQTMTFHDLSRTQAPRTTQKNADAADLEAFLEKMAELWRKESLCGVTILVGNETFRAHRLILAASSDYMRALFCGDRLKDSTKETIELPDMEGRNISLRAEMDVQGAL